MRTIEFAHTVAGARVAAGDAHKKFAYITASKPLAPTFDKLVAETELMCTGCHATKDSVEGAVVAGRKAGRETRD
eukprot:COSAG06_NODE_7663_length_2423_cov_4.607143_2_plen_75_part_00